MEVGLNNDNMAFEETELRLGLPGGNAEELLRKRGFSETQTQDHTATVDLMLNLSSKEPAPGPDPSHKHSDNTLLPADPAKPPAK